MKKFNSPFYCKIQHKISYTIFNEIKYWFGRTKNFANSILSIKPMLNDFLVSSRYLLKAKSANKYRM